MHQGALIDRSSDGWAGLALFTYLHLAGECEDLGCSILGSSGT